jgi:hypothetical protein
MGELLPLDDKNFCPEDTLLWSDINFKNGKGIMIHIKVTKSKSKEGEFEDIFLLRVTGVALWPRCVPGGMYQGVLGQTQYFALLMGEA